MTFMQKIRYGLQKLMAGRRGADEFSLMLLIAGLVVSMLGGALNLGILNLLGLAAYAYAIFRMFSRNLEKRYAENVKFTGMWRSVKQSVRQFINRTKNMKQYKYFKCPQCHSRLKLPRKVGEVTVTCGKCHHAFKQRA